jgi:hypothetical protein
MIALLKFDLNDSDDKRAHARTLKATDMACVLFEIQNNLYREFSNKTPVGGIDYQEGYQYALNEVFTKISDLLEEANINLEELIN